MRVDQSGQDGEVAEINVACVIVVTGEGSRGAGLHLRDEASSAVDDERDVFEELLLLRIEEEIGVDGEGIDLESETRIQERHFGQN